MIFHTFYEKIITITETFTSIVYTFVNCQNKCNSICAISHIAFSLINQDSLAMILY